eukprot:CAMPEP_0182898288 /NCGR_PEP_ID=MMETSP0034_2-20130328/27393_1 /TAXON_ID=156128 /ORGANISM="Nephroselmis pyriformis, Strain CCMP717" /LENGTH=298 /DNA_ID=CAMNT_0025032251 /DNA_START=5 /DNA_END=898 /DNA_ORIENTATION=+
MGPPTTTKAKKPRGGYISPTPVLVVAAAFNVVAGVALLTAPQAALSPLAGPGHAVDPAAADVARKMGPLLISEAALLVGVMYLKPGQQITASALFAARFVLGAAACLYMLISERWGWAHWITFGFQFAASVGFAKCAEQIYVPSHINTSLRGRDPVTPPRLVTLYWAAGILGGVSGAVLAAKPTWILDGNLPKGTSPLMAQDAARLLGVLLMGEAGVMMHIKDTPSETVARVGVAALAARAAVSTGVALWNQLSGRWAASNWSDPVMCAAFAVAYVALGAPLFKKRREGAGALKASDA